MDLKSVLLLGVAIGFLSCLALRSDCRRGVLYLFAGAGVVAGAVFVSIIAGEHMTSWYLDALGIGVLLNWMTMLGGIGQLRNLLRKLKSALR